MSFDAESSRKQIAFDLRQEDLKEHYGKNHENSYRDLKDFFKKSNWEHRQGSVYASKGAVSYPAIHDLLKEAVKKMPWLDKCARRIDVTEVGAEHDLRDALKEIAKEVHGSHAKDQDMELHTEPNTEPPKSLADIKNEIEAQRSSEMSDIVKEVSIKGRGDR